MIEQREKLKAVKDTSQQLRMEYEELDRNTKREIRRDLRVYNYSQIKEIMENSKSIKKIRKQTRKGTHWMLGVKDEAGRKLTSREEFSKEATKFYSQLYESTSQSILPIMNQFTDPTEDVPNILPS